LGGVFSNVSDLRTKYTTSIYSEIQESYYSMVSEQKNIKGDNVHIPVSYGIGFASYITEGVMIAGDVYQWRYKKLSVGENDAQSYKNAIRFSGGIEFGGNRFVNKAADKKWSFRVGGYVWDLYTKDINGAAIREKFLTGGISIPFNNLNSRIDIGLEGGVRTPALKNSGSETIVRLYIGFSSSEKWFERKTKNK